MSAGPRTVRKASGSWERWGRDLALMFGSILVAMLVLEGVVRLALSPTDVVRHRGDALVGFSLEPAQTGAWKKGPIRSRFSVNRQGYNNENDYRMERTPDRLRVAVLGDSFVEAFQVPPGQRFFDLLEHDLSAEGLDVEIYTFAVSGYGTGDQMLILERDVAKYRPDVVITVFVRNDPSDTACALDPPSVKSCFSLANDGSLVRRDAIPHRPNPFGRLVLRSALARYLLVQRSFLDRARSRWMPAPPRTSIFEIEPTPQWIVAWQVVEACLGRMTHFCRDRGIRFLVVNQPLVDAGTRAALAARGGVAADLNQPAVRLREAAKRTGFAFIDLATNLERATALSPDPLLYESEGHWSPAGHRAVAAALRPILRRELAPLTEQRGSVPPAPEQPPHGPQRSSGRPRE